VLEEGGARGAKARSSSLLPDMIGHALRVKGRVRVGVSVRVKV
jgi:hypothetical protein